MTSLSVSSTTSQSYQEKTSSLLMGIRSLHLCPAGVRTITPKEAAWGGDEQDQSKRNQPQVVSVRVVRALVTPS